MPEILCLANSPKENARCIAGLDLKTGRLVRPVSATTSQVIPNDWAVAQGKPVEPLDVIDIPFVRGDAVVPFQAENRYCKEGWDRTDRWKASDIRRFCESDSRLLGTADSEPIAERFFKLKRHGRAGWKSLQLIHVRSVDFRQVDEKWMGSFRTRNKRWYDLRLTDERFIEGIKPTRKFECLLLLSLTRP